MALGHLHRPQTAGKESIRYSGSPLAFGFDEADTTKTMTLFDLAADGSLEDFREIAFEPLRKVREVRGLMADLVAEAGNAPSEDYISAILLDEGCGGRASSATAAVLSKYFADLAREKTRAGSCKCRPARIRN